MPEQTEAGDPNNVSRRTFLKGFTGAAGIGLLGGMHDCTTVEVRKTNFHLPRWDANGFRVVQISDLHVNTRAQMLRGLEAVHLALEHKADLIALTGDNVNYLDKITGKHLQKIISELDQAKCPVVAIFGNHDWWGGSIQEQVDMFRKSRIKVLQNRSLEVSGVTVAGLDDFIAMAGHTDFIRHGTNSKSLLALWHEPDAVQMMPTEASLQLSGHSHGGEICLPGGIPIHTPGGAKMYKAGFYLRKENDMPLYVSRGIATLGPCRIYCPPEITIHTISSNDGGPARMESIA